MMTEDRPVFTAGLPVDKWWRYVVVTLSADEQVALNRLATRERREKADMASLLIVHALEESGLLPKEVEEAPF
jgi:hypothetical protein